jgi:hypothetical protein
MLALRAITRPVAEYMSRPCDDFNQFRNVELNTIAMLKHTAWYRCLVPLPGTEPDHTRIRFTLGSSSRDVVKRCLVPGVTTRAAVLFQRSRHRGVNEHNLVTDSTTWVALTEASYS